MRTFLAVSLADLFERELQEWFLKYKDTARARWNAVSEIHITLHFFGPTTAEQLERIKKIAAEMAIGVEPFSLALEGCDFFPESGPPRILWAGVKGDGSLEKFRKKLEDRLAEDSFECEKRPFKPHGTLGRMPSGFRMEGSFDFPATQFRVVKSYHLYQSVMKPAGMRYEILETFDFSPLF